MVFLFWCILAVVGIVNGAASGCETKGTFKSEKGDFVMSWCFPTEADIQISLTMAGSTFIALGVGGSMYDADMIAGWVDSSGNPVIKDYYSSEEARPEEDIVLGGTDDITLVSGSAQRSVHTSMVNNATSSSSAPSTTLVFTRKLVTGDKYDRDISITEPNDMIYAWGDSGSTDGGLEYHGDNHNHIFVDFSKADGIPDNLFGYEESGGLSRDLIHKSYYGTLATLQTAGAGNSQVSDYPYASIADFADEEPSTGKPLILLSDLERTVINLADEPKCSLHVISTPETIAQFEHPELYDVMTLPRTTLLGRLEIIPEGDELEAAKATYTAKHPKSKAWINFSDFHLYRMAIEDVYVVGGFGNDHYIGWMSPEQYLSAKITV